MYHVLDESEGKVVGIELGDTFTEADMQALEADLDEVIAAHGGVRLLARFDGVPSLDPRALDDDIAFWLEHRDDLERYAVVSEGRLVEWVVELEDKLLGTDVRHFTPDEEDAAWEWLREE